MTSDIIKIYSAYNHKMVLDTVTPATGEVFNR